MKRRWILIFFALVLLLSGTVLCIAAETQTFVPSAEEVALPITMVVHKVDGGTQLPVEGAVFVLSNEEGSYLASASEDADRLWTDDVEEAYPLTTDRDGTIAYYGLFPGTYYMKETQAPEGYILLEEPIKIQLSAEYGTDSNGELVITSVTAQVNEEDPVVGTDGERIDITIENTYGTVLPATGGVGMASYYMFSFVIIFALALVIVAKRLIREQ